MASDYEGAEGMKNIIMENVTLTRECDHWGDYCSCHEDLEAMVDELIWRVACEERMKRMKR